MPDADLEEFNAAVGGGEDTDEAKKARGKYLGPCFYCGRGVYENEEHERRAYCMHAEYIEALDKVKQGEILPAHDSCHLEHNRGDSPSPPTE